MDTERFLFVSTDAALITDLARGTDPDPEVHNGYQIAVRVVLPPFPFDDEQTYDENSRNAAVVFQTESRDGIHLEDAKQVDGDGDRLQAWGYLGPRV